MSSTKMDPDQARQRDFLLDSNRWYIVYPEFVFEKGKKKKKKRLQEKKTLINFRISDKLIWIYTVF